MDHEKLYPTERRTIAPSKLYRKLTALHIFHRVTHEICQNHMPFQIVTFASTIVAYLVPLVLVCLGLRELQRVPLILDRGA